MGDSPEISAQPGRLRLTGPRQTESCLGANSPTLPSLPSGQGLPSAAGPALHPRAFHGTA